MEINRDNKKSNVFTIPMIIVIVIILILFIVGVFFRVRTIEVNGNSIYSSDKIIEASGVELGDNLFFINRFTASSNIFTQLPYVDGASIERILPATIKINVTESDSVAFINWNGQNWVINIEGKFLGSVEEKETAGLIEIIGIDSIAPSSGDKISDVSEENLKTAYLEELLVALRNNGIIKEVQSIDFSDSSNAVVECYNRLQVKFGMNDQLDYKIRMLLATISQLGENESAVVDISDAETAYVSLN